jgi:nucleoside phosphorylase
VGQRACGDAWDEEAKGSIYLRGHLSINMGLAGSAVQGLRLGGGVGDYSVRVYAGNRDQVTRRYAELFDRHRNPLSDEFQQEKKTLEGLERYLVQLWRESLPVPGTGGNP